MEEQPKLIRTPFDPGPLSISEIFHENTKMRRSLVYLHPISYPAMIDDEKLTDMLTNGFKIYSMKPSIKLSYESQPTVSSFEEVLLTRRSVREYSEAPLTFQELSKLLFLSSGVTSRQKLDEENILHLRAYPSAGGLCPLEIYPVVFRITDIKSGLYHYNVRDNSIELLESSELKKKVSTATMYPEIIENSSLILLLTAMFPRTTSKYGERGYRFVLIEAGHLAQNIYLIATALGLGCVAIGGFIDDELNDLIEVDGINEAVIYMLALGRPSK